MSTVKILTKRLDTVLYTRYHSIDKQIATQGLQRGKLSNITIKSDKCKSCYLCIEACPKKLIAKSDVIGKTGNNLVYLKDDNKECKGCAFCALSCPDLAIVEVVNDK
jgi:2-oxoglutarate ferredoxin oxidoreductase subunit delta